MPEIYFIIGGWGGENEVAQPGNRFVSFVRASGRARARREISYGYLEVFAERTSSSARGGLFCLVRSDLSIKTKIWLLFYTFDLFSCGKTHAFLCFLLFSIFAQRFPFVFFATC